MSGTRVRMRMPPFWTDNGPVTCRGVQRSSMPEPVFVSDFADTLANLPETTPVPWNARSGSVIVYGGDFIRCRLAFVSATAPPWTGMEFVFHAATPPP